MAQYQSVIYNQQGKRNDILAQLEMLEKPSDTEENGTCSQVANKPIRKGSAGDSRKGAADVF